MALFGGKTPDPEPTDPSRMILRGRHARPITPVDNNPDMTDAQRDQLARDVALFDELH